MLPTINLDRCFTLPELLPDGFLAYLSRLRFFNCLCQQFLRNNHYAIAVAYNDVTWIYRYTTDDNCRIECTSFQARRSPDTKPPAKYRKIHCFNIICIPNTRVDHKSCNSFGFGAKAHKIAPISGFIIIRTMYHQHVTPGGIRIRAMYY